MIDSNEKVVAALEATGMQVFYELFVDSTTPIPCITYYESNNSDYLVGDTLEYSNISTYVKAYARNISEAFETASKVDQQMKLIGFTRSSANLLTVNGLVMYVLKYDVIGYEYKS